MKRYLFLILFLLSSKLLIFSETNIIYYLKLNSRNFISLYSNITIEDFNKITKINTKELKLSEISSAKRFCEILEIKGETTTPYLIYYDNNCYYLLKGNFKADEYLIKKYGNDEKVIERYPADDKSIKVYKIDFDLQSILKKYFDSNFEQDLIKSYKKVFFR